MKTAFQLLLFCLFINATAVAQDTSPCEELTTIQPYGLVDNKITFRSDQIDIATVSVISCSDTDESFTEPTYLIAEDHSTIQIDFSECDLGTYIILGTRGELPLRYSIQLSPSH